ncbi:MAG: insulinase family protein [Rhodospirillales bacterium]|nr:insulinase family protein [Rhodospirillales bacterium]
MQPSGPVVVLWRRLLCGAGVLALAVLLSPVPAFAVQIEKIDGDGIEAWLVEDHANPIIAMRIAFRDAGASRDPADQSGRATMVAGLLDEGAGDLESDAFQQRLEDQGIRLGFDAGQDTFAGTVQTLTQHREIAFDLLRLALTQPRFDAEPVARIRNQLQAALRQEAEDPNAVAARTLWSMLYPHHPYGRPPGGTAESLERITVADLRQFVAERLARDRLVVGVVGDITPEQLRGVLISTFAGLAPHAAPGSVADVAANADGRIAVVDMNVPQSAIAFAQAGLRRDDARFYALNVLNQILGGSGLTSRLFDEVREKRGLAYSVYTGLAPLDHSALILGGAGTANKSAGETVAVIRRVWARIAHDGVSDSELADAKAYLTGSFPLRFAGSGRLAALLVSIQIENLGIDYLNRREHLINDVVRSDVDALARELLDADRLTFAIVGHPQGLHDAR